MSLLSSTKRSPFALLQQYVSLQIDCICSTLVLRPPPRPADLANSGSVSRADQYRLHLPRNPVPELQITRQGSARPYVGDSGYSGVESGSDTGCEGHGSRKFSPFRLRPTQIFGLIPILLGKWSAFPHLGGIFGAPQVGHRWCFFGLEVKVGFRIMPNCINF
ncbi:hypothetical protein JTE90_029043 [Oedothorax gibbosus]|uniref:Uncharacterized protein n=1 Tax=Oedothorax gibbosus TaxID=931172 RepID=A0AAV6UUF8_9ARAC|nr:hypothetical protein JTE90_029043 [Oedothorax gibbosus]